MRIMKLRSTLILLTGGILLLVGCNTVSGSVTSVSLDFPHGETRLLVQRDGDTRLYYGELPAYKAVKNGTFDIDELFNQLQTRIHKVVPAEERPTGQPYGMVTFGFSDGSTRDHLIYDEPFAEDLFATAQANLVDAAP
jgi:hypothetical protein